MSDIDRRMFLKGLGVIGLDLALGGVPATVRAAPATAKPNFVFILIDDMGYGDVGCYGSRFYQTPNIDRLAAQGMRFTDAYAACPVCSPTRLSIMTGKYPARVRLTNYLTGQRWPDNSPLKPLRDWVTQMPAEEVTIAEALRAGGYATGMAGKWHLESRTDKTLAPLAAPTAQGFETATGRVPSQKDKGVAGLTDKAVEFIRANQDRPFFFYLSHNSVHIPLEATPEQIGKYKARVRPDDPQNNPIYAGMVEAVDTSVGRVMATLDELGLAERTVVVFFSDNGGLSVKEGANTPATSNLPLKAGKGYVYEGGIREPLIVRWPGVIKPGSTCDTPVCSVDFHPTFLELAGLKPQAGQIIDGVSIAPLLRQTGGVQRDALFWHYPHYSNQGGLPSGAVRVGDHKLIEFYDDGHLELYNLRDDPGEHHNLAQTMPEKAAELRKRLDEWRASVAAQLPAKNPDYDPAKPFYSDPKKAPDAWKNPR